MMWGYGMGGFGWLFMFAWLVLVIAVVVWLVRTAAGSVDGGDGRQGAKRILDERFAAGELSVEEYEQRRRVLR